MFCRLLHQDFGSDFRVFDPEIGDESRSEIYDTVVKALYHRNPDRRHAVILRHHDTMISGWFVRMNELETDYKQDDCGRNIFGFIGVSRCASLPIMVPTIHYISRLYNECIGPIWENGELNEHPPANPLVLDTEDILDRPKVKHKTKKGTVVYRGFMDSGMPEDASDNDVWLYVSNVGKIDVAKKMGAGFCSLR